MGINVDSVSGLIYKVYRALRYRTSIEEVKLRRPTLTPPKDDEDGNWVFSFLLGFKMANSNPDLAENARFAIVVEYDSITSAGGRDAINFGDALEEFDGLSEPQITPIEFRTDLENFLKVRDARNEDASFSEKIPLDNRIKVKIKASADGVTGKQEKRTIWRLIENWVDNNRGMNIWMFAEQQEFDELDDPAEAIIGEDIP